MASRPARSEAERRALARVVAEALPGLLPEARWFARKGSPILATRLRDAVPLGAGAARTWLALVDVVSAGGAQEVYAVPLLLRSGGGLDALDDPRACVPLLAAVERQTSIQGTQGRFRFTRTALFPRLAPAASLAPRRVGAEQSNTTIAFGDVLVLKLLRRLAPGISPEHEMTAYLTTRARLGCVPAACGAIEYRPSCGEAWTLGVVQRFVPHRGDGWSWAGEHLAALRDAVEARAARAALGAGDVVELVRDVAGELLRGVRQLGVATGEMHAALAAGRDDPAFAPEPVSAEDCARWAARIVADVGRTTATLRARLEALEPVSRGHAEVVLAREEALAARAGALALLAREGCAKIRVHGDLHLGQVLRTDDGFVIIDFEGEPARPLAERRAKRCALVDVAGMLRSLDYAAAAAGRQPGAPPAWARAWLALARRAFRDGHRAGAAGAAVRLWPAAPASARRVVAALELDKTLYEIRYEIDQRPAWLAIPLGALAAADLDRGAERSEDGGSRPAGGATAT